MSTKNTPAGRPEEKALPRLVPATDILEREDGFYVYMDMPGVKKEDLSLDLQDSELTVTGKTSVVAGEKENFIEVQFGVGEYRRSVSLAEIVDRQKIRANLKNGVLELFMPRVEKATPRRIEIQAG
jgi:HSP20 family molecular chaperone IbpA